MNKWDTCVGEHFLFLEDMGKARFLKDCKNGKHNLENGVRQRRLVGWGLSWHFSVAAAAGLGLK